MKYHAHGSPLSDVVIKFLNGLGHVVVILGPRRNQVRNVASLRRGLAGRGGGPDSMRHDNHEEAVNASDI